MLAASLVVSVAALLLANRYVVAMSSLGQAQQTKTQKWEYCHLESGVFSGGSSTEGPHYGAMLLREGSRDQIDGKDEVAILNKLGAEGWEVVCIIPRENQGSSPSFPLYLLKRPK
jgi:hypothetical protein